MLDDMEVEIDCAWYPYKTTVYPFHMNTLMPLEQSVNPVHLRNTGVIDAAGARWASSMDRVEFFWPRCIEEWEQKQPERKLSRFSISLKGQSFLLTTFAIKNVWYILNAMGMLDKMEELEVRNLHTVVSYVYPCAWFTMATPGYAIQPFVAEFRAKNVRSLSLECGEYQTGGFEATVSQLKVTFPSLESLSITKVGLFLREELVFLDTLTTLKRLRVTELSSPDLEDDNSPDSIHDTNLLVECMELILHPPNLQMMEWNRGGYQRVLCDITCNSLKQIDFVDVWLTLGGEKVLVGERYDGWYFREELFYGTGSESRWGKLWMKRFVHDSVVVEDFDFEEDCDEGMRSEGSGEAISW